MSHAPAGHTGASHGSYKSYLIGFILSMILTAIPFSMVIQDFVNESTQIAVLVMCAVGQIVVHLVYFLHLNMSSEQQWNLIALIFSVMIIAIMVIGSLWIMWYLDHNLMRL